MHLVDDIDLVAGRGGTVAHRINDLADIANPGAGGRVHLQHIHMAALGNGDAGLAGATRLDGGFFIAGAVQPLGDDACRGGFAGASDAGHDESMRNAVRLKGVFQGADHRVLPDEVFECVGAVFAGQNLVGFLRITHGGQHSKAGGFRRGEIGLAWWKISGRPRCRKNIRR